MKLVVRTVHKDQLDVIIDDGATVAGLKEKIQEEHAYTAKKIVYKGKVLEDDNLKLVDAGVVDGESCVLIGNRQKGAVAAAQKVTEERKKEVTLPSTAAASSSSPPAAAAASSAPAAPQSSSETAASAAGAFVTGDELEETVNMILAMGDWPREKVVRALHAAFNNPDRAVEFLLTDSIPTAAAPPQPQEGSGGVPGGAQGSSQAGSQQPSQPQQQAGQQQQQQQQQQAGGGQQIVINVPGVGQLSPEQIAQIMAIIQRPGQPTPDPQALTAFLTQLARIPQGQGQGQQGQGAGGQGAQLSPLAERLSQIAEFDQIRALVATDSTHLTRVMQMLSQQDPELFRLIQDNQQEFLQIIRQGIPGSGGSGAGGQQQQVVTLTEQDQQAIERLVDLGFSREQAAQAYVMADKNEELAANLLFDGGAMDQD